jgi:lipoyl(octanoyl) transferase
LNTVQLIKSGKTDYKKSWEMQKTLFDQVVKSRDKNYLILTEHHPVITIGKTGSTKNLIADPAILRSQNIDVVHIDRGGDITFHGHGQLVGYPILDLTKFQKDVHWYLRCLEEIIILTLKEFSIDATRIKGLTGVWVKNQKICAIGIKVTRWVTMHGFALNISTNLDNFAQIIPCGITNRGVTSISVEVGNKVDVKDVINRLCGNFSKIFNVELLQNNNF